MKALRFLSGHVSCATIAVNMDFETILRCLAYLANFLANVPKACEALGKGWVFFTKFLRSLDSDEVREDAPPPPEPICINVHDTIPMALHGGYAALRHRQNAYYYAQGSDVSVPLNGQAITSHAGRLLLSPPPLCINVFN